jgi:hypothetical protein
LATTMAVHWAGRKVEKLVVLKAWSLGGMMVDK